MSIDKEINFEFPGTENSVLKLTSLNIGKYALQILSEKENGHVLTAGSDCCFKLRKHCLFFG
jgi:hypothetical protein